MMVSEWSAEVEVNELKFFIKLVIDSLLIDMHDPVSALEELIELRRFEDRLRELEDAKKYDRNH